MKPMLWKELRQNLKWAIAVLAVMSVAAIYIVWLLSSPGQSMHFFGLRFYGWQSTPFDQLQVLSVLGCPLAGLVLGVLHVLPEKRQDLWAFLVHRPNSRTTIFLAKASAGLLLYLVAVGIPVAVGTAWLATPGRVAAPFYWPMALPGIADVQVDFSVYVATRFGLFDGVVNWVPAVSSTDARHDVGVHLHETPVGIVGESWVSGLLRQGGGCLIVEPEIENRIHHSGQRHLRAGTDGDEQRCRRIAEPPSGGGLQATHGFVDFAAEFFWKFAVGEVLGAERGGDGEARRNWYAQLGHLV